MRTAFSAALLCALAQSTLACSPDDAGPAPGEPSAPDPYSARVDPFIGSGGFAYHFGSAFPGAVAPNGLAKVGPDTKGPWGTVRWLHFSGYWYGDDVIQGFSHLHLHGTGATDYGVLSFMPSDGFDASRITPAGYESPFRKETEEASPGYYAVTLDRGSIRAEMTATTRAAHHRYLYPSDAAEGHILIDLNHHLESGSIAGAEATLFPAEQRVRGHFRSIGGMSDGFGGYEVYFAIRARAPWTSQRVWKDGAPPADGTEIQGTGAGFALSFDTASGEPIELKVGLSLVSEDAAEKNLDAEIPGWDFDATRAETAAAWDARVNLVRVSGRSGADHRIMMTSLYHAFLMPTIQSDVDGGYRGVDGQVHAADGFQYLSDMSLWDTYRTLHPLYDLIAPERSIDTVRSLHEMAKAGGFFPKWPIATGEAGTMIGSSAEVVVADAYVKGIRDFDAKDVYSRLRAAAVDPVAPAGGRGGRNHVEPYMVLGYVPASIGRSVSHTTEYGNDDFALAELAAALGETEDAALLHERARGYRKLFDPETGFLWAKNEDGSFAADRTRPEKFAEGYAEANAWQSVWMPAYDVDGLAELFGGRAELVEKLTSFFELAREELSAIDPTDMVATGAMPTYYWHGNEPDIHAVYLFAQAGRPDLTQKWLPWIINAHYSPKPDGLAGNDDGGTLAAWYVFSALGFYPLPGSDRYIVGAPRFPRAEIAVKGGTFTVEAKEVSDANIYVQSVELNGAPLAAPEVRHSDLKAGGSLRFTMGPSPSAWGRSTEP